MRATTDRRRRRSASGFGLMEALGHPQFHLVGHDWGGQLSWLIATQAPGKSPNQLTDFNPIICRTWFTMPVCWKIHHHRTEATVTESV